MTEQEKLDYYELHGHRPPENYIIYRLSFRTGRVIDRTEQRFNTTEEANKYCQTLTEGSEDDGRITLLFIDRNSAEDETVKKSFEELIQMFWPEAVKDTLQMYFEIL